MSVFFTKEQLAKIEEGGIAIGKRFHRYVAKLNEIEKNEEGSPKKKKPYYEQKEWLISRAATLLGLYRGKSFPGREPQLVIYPHEAAKILKKDIRSAYRILKIIKDKFDIPSRVPVPMRVFCEYCHQRVEDVIKALTEA